MHKDNISSELKAAVDVALLKHKAMHDVAGDKKKMNYAFGILVISALAGGLGMKFFGGFFTPTWGMVIGMAIYQLISAVIGIFVLSVVAKSIFKGNAAHDAFFRVLAFGMIVTWLSIVPFLSIIGGIWGLVILFVALKVVHKLTTGGAIGTILVTIIAMALISLILSPAMAALGIRGMYGGSFDFNGAGKSFMNFDNKDDFEMHMDVPTGEGSMKMEDGKMTITGPDGETMEINIPDYN